MNIFLNSEMTSLPSDQTQRGNDLLVLQENTPVSFGEIKSHPISK